MLGYVGVRLFGLVIMISGMQYLEECLLLWFNRVDLFPPILKLLTESSSALLPSESSIWGGILRRKAGFTFVWFKLERWGAWKICDADVAKELWAELEKDVEDDNWRVEEVFLFEIESWPADSDFDMRSCIPANLSTSGEGDRPPGWSTVPSELSLQLSLPFNEEPLSISIPAKCGECSTNSFIASLLKLLSIEDDEDKPCWCGGKFPDPLEFWGL